MLKIQPKPTFWAPVEIHVPGEARPTKVQIEFNFKGRDELQTYFEEIKDKSAAEALAELVVGWKDVDVEFSADNLGTLLNNYVGAADAIFEVFSKEVLRAKEKNSQP